MDGLKLAGTQREKYHILSTTVERDEGSTIPRAGSNSHDDWIWLALCDGVDWLQMIQIHNLYVLEVLQLFQAQVTRILS